MSDSLPGDSGADPKKHADALDAESERILSTLDSYVTKQKEQLEAESHALLEQSRQNLAEAIAERNRQLAAGDAAEKSQRTAVKKLPDAFGRAIRAVGRNGRRFVSALRRLMHVHEGQPHQTKERNDHAGISGRQGLMRRLFPTISKKRKNFRS